MIGLNAWDVMFADLREACSQMNIPFWCVQVGSSAEELEGAQGHWAPACPLAECLTHVPICHPQLKKDGNPYLSPSFSCVPLAQTASVTDPGIFLLLWEDLPSIHVAQAQGDSAGG